MILTSTEIASIALSSAAIEAKFPLSPPVWISTFPEVLWGKDEQLPSPQFVVYPLRDGLTALHTTNPPVPIAPDPP